MAALKKVDLCIVEVAAWLTINLLKLNREKSEAIVFFPAKQRDSLSADVEFNLHRVCAIWVCNLIVT